VFLTDSVFWGLHDVEKWGTKGLGKDLSKEQHIYKQKCSYNASSRV